MSFLGFGTVGQLGKLQESSVFAALDRLNDRENLDGKCAWCSGSGFRKYICSPASAPSVSKSGIKAIQEHFHHDCDCEPCLGGQHTHAEICGHCEGSGLDVELGVAG